MRTRACSPPDKRETATSSCSGRNRKRLAHAATCRLRPCHVTASPSGTRGEPERAAAADDSEVADAAVFEALRILRRTIAEERGVPPYLIFSDASLRDMARVRPLTLAKFRDVKGVGDWKLETFGERFVAAVRQACLASSSAQRE